MSQLNIANDLDLGIDDDSKGCSYWYLSLRQLKTHGKALACAKEAGATPYA